MDCDTTGIEPDFALVKFKKLAGGGYFKIINRSVPDALKTLGYSEAQTDAIIRYAVGHGTLKGAPGINAREPDGAGLRRRGRWRRSKSPLAAAFDIKFAFNKWTLGEEFCTARSASPASRSTTPGFDMLAALGFSKAEIEAANTYCCGAMTLEGAPDLEPDASCRSSTAPIPAAASASASSPPRAISA